MPRMSIRTIRYRPPKNPTWDLDLERRIRLVPEEQHGIWDFGTLFGRSAPVEVEIGFGKARYIIAAARKWSDRNWLGIEYVRACVMLGGERCAEAELENVHLIMGAAEDILAEHVGDSTVDAYHLYFPDPWPKKRHHKRRIVQPAFVAEIMRTLKPNGRFHIATDYTEYYEQIVPTVESGGFLHTETLEVPDEEEFRTNFEQKAIVDGSTIHRISFAKPA
jgi:tRNA (guanine-N7-)-methyltransferase